MDLTTDAISTENINQALEHNENCSFVVYRNDTRHNDSALFSRKVEKVVENGETLEVYFKNSPADPTNFQAVLIVELSNQDNNRLYFRKRYIDQN